MPRQIECLAEITREFTTQDEDGVSKPTITTHLRIDCANCEVALDLTAQTGHILSDQMSLNREGVDVIQKICGTKPEGEEVIPPATLRPMPDFPIRRQYVDLSDHT